MQALRTLVSVATTHLLSKTIRLFARKANEAPWIADIASQGAPRIYDTKGKSGFSCMSFAILYLKG